MWLVFGLEQTWEWDECSGGAVALHRFALRWATLDEAALQLWPIEAMWLEPLRLSLRETRAESVTRRDGLAPLSDGA